MTAEAQLLTRHDPVTRRFTLPIDGQEAILQYELQGSDVDFTHTYVPPELRGGGHARILVDAGLAWARAQRLNINASCWYVRKILDEA